MDFRDFINDEDFAKLIKGTYETTININLDTLNRSFEERMKNDPRGYRTARDSMRDFVVTEDGTRYVKVECAYAEIYDKI